MNYCRENKKRKNLLLIATLLLIAGLPVCGINEENKNEKLKPVTEKTILKYDFENLQQLKNCKPWALEPQNMTIVIDDNTKNHVLQLTADTRSWNTVIISPKPPVLVTENTIIQFRIKSIVEGNWEVNLENASEQYAEYAMAFTANKDQWTQVILPLKHAIYKRRGKPGYENDGFSGDKLSSVQIASRGNKIMIDDFEIINVSSKDERLKKKEIPEALAMLGKAKTNFKNTQLETFFPYGVILNYSGGMAPTAELMGQSLEAMFKRSLQDIRMHHMNLICPFCCNASDLPGQIAMAKETDLKIFPTSYLKPWTAKKLEAMEKYKDDSTIVAWYWVDEPGPGAIEDFQRDAAALKEIDTKHPMSMAMCSRPSVAAYAPYLDISCIDPYPVLWGPYRPIADIDSWMTFTRKHAKGRIWAIPQAFGNKTFKRGGSAMPSATEIRALSWSAVAGGAAGLIYFIYDSHPYLDPAYIKEIEKGKELIYGLKDGIRRSTDAWDELGRMGETLPSIGQILLDAEVDPLQEINWTYETTEGGIKGYLRTDKVRNRQYLFFFSENVQSANEIMATFPSGGTNSVLLNLATLTEVSMAGKTQYKFALLPGDGVCFFLGERDEAKQVVLELKAIRLNDWRRMAEVKLEKHRAWLDNIEEYQVELTKISNYKVMKAFYYQIDDILNQNPQYQSAHKLIENARELIGGILDATFNSRFRLKNDPAAADYRGELILTCAKALGECELAFETNSTALEARIATLKKTILQLKLSRKTAPQSQEAVTASSKEAYDCESL